MRASVALGLLLALTYGLIGGVGEFPLDDAWIHLAYAKSLRLGEGLSYNPGDWETGFSSPLWVVLLAAWPSEPDPVVSVRLLGALLHAAGSGLAALLALELARARASLARPAPVLSVALLAGILTAAQPTLLQGASSGMEVALASTLLLACVLACQREQWLIAGATSALAELARPEAIAFLLGFACVRALAHRRVHELIPLLGAALGLGAWTIYCAIVSGWPWPNTAYVKVGSASIASGWAYLQAQVLPEQPWLVGLGGVLLIAAALLADLKLLDSSRFAWLRAPGQQPSEASEPRRFDLVALLVGWAVAMLATALSRPLDPAILFYQSRYFAIFAAIPPVIMALGLIRIHRWLGLALVLPVALVLGLQIPASQALQREQERGVALLHGDPARFVARELPADAIVAVEGAGALRYFTPRTMTIVDIIGLNDAEIAHAQGDAAKACVLVERAPGWFVLPDHIAAALGQVFVLRVVREFVDPHWAQIEQPREVRVVLLEVVDVQPRWRERCGQP